MAERNWRPLSVFVRELRETAARLGRLRPSDLRVTAGEVAAQRHGIDVLASTPELLNVAALALSLEQLVVHDLRTEVPELVDATDLHALPSEPPRLLRRAWILESDHVRGRPLFGDTAALGGYELGGVTYLVGLGLAGWARVARWSPRWTGEDLGAGVELDTSPLIDSPDEHAGWTREAARFAVVFGLLLDAAGSPVRVTDEASRPKAPPVRSKKTKPPPAWVTRYVSLSPAPWAAAGGPGAEASAAQAGREAARVGVRGHLKRQRHGPGGSEVRWIYVAGYEARRWIAPGARRVVVSG